MSAAAAQVWPEPWCTQRFGCARRAGTLQHEQLWGNEVIARPFEVSGSSDRCQRFTRSMPAAHPLNVSGSSARLH